MIRKLLRASLWITGYGSLIIGLLTLIGIFRLLFNIIPEIVIAQWFGFFLVLIGFYMLGRYEKMGRPK